MSYRLRKPGAVLTVVPRSAVVCEITRGSGRAGSDDNPVSRRAWRHPLLFILLVGYCETEIPRAGASRVVPDDRPSHIVEGPT